MVLKKRWVPLLVKQHREGYLPCVRGLALRPHAPEQGVECGVERLRHVFEYLVVDPIRSGCFLTGHVP